MNIDGELPVCTPHQHSTKGNVVRHTHVFPFGTRRSMLMKLYYKAGTSINKIASGLEIDLRHVTRDVTILSLQDSRTFVLKSRHNCDALSVFITIHHPLAKVTLDLVPTLAPMDPASKPALPVAKTSLRYVHFEIRRLTLGTTISRAPTVPTRSMGRGPLRT